MLVECTFKQSSKSQISFSSLGQLTGFSTFLSCQTRSVSHHRWSATHLTCCLCHYMVHMSGREMKKQQTKQIRKPSLLCLFHQLSGTFGPALCLVESSVCQKCIKQSKHIEMIEKALKCSELEPSSVFVRSSLYGPVRCPSNESISDEGELHRILNSLTINSNAEE